MISPERQAEIEHFAGERGYGPEVLAVLVEFGEWQAAQRAERIRAGLAVRRERGDKVGGRAPGAKDRAPRESMKGNQNARKDKTRIAES